jgi:hypothetical protein
MNRIDLFILSESRTGLGQQEFGGAARNLTA